MFKISMLNSAVLSLTCHPGSGWATFHPRSEAIFKLKICQLECMRLKSPQSNSMSIRIINPDESGSLHQGSISAISSSTKGPT